MKTVTVDVDAEGNVKVAAAGVHGVGCKALTDAIERSLGASVSDVKTSEFFQTVRQGQNAKS